MNLWNKSESFVDKGSGYFCWGDKESVGEGLVGLSGVSCRRAEETSKI